MIRTIAIVIIWFGLVAVNDTWLHISDPHNLMTYGFVSGIISLALGWIIDTLLKGG